MRDLERRELGDAGLAYVRAHLDNINVLCTALLRAMEASAGLVFTMAPRGTSDERLAHFKSGGLLVENADMSRATRLEDGSAIMPVLDLLEEQAAFLRQHVRRTADLICVVDDYNPRWSQQLHLLPTSFGVGEEVYNLLAPENSEDDFLSAIGASNTIWHGVAAILKGPLVLDPSRTCSAEALERAAASVELITCTAYDGEGFVGWLKRCR